MWWPSVKAVVYDLWQFVTGHEVPPLYTHADDQLSTSQRMSRLADPVRLHLGNDASLQKSVVTLSLAERYDAQHETTVRIRTYLQQHTTVPTATGVLTAYEWLAYAQHQNQRALPWSKLALQPIGHWHQIMKGVPGVRIETVPRTGSLIEWRDEQLSGQIGLVTSVAPDQQIVIDRLGGVTPGVLTRDSFEYRQWRELRPVFISVV